MGFGYDLPPPSCVSLQNEDSYERLLLFIGPSAEAELMV